MKSYENGELCHIGEYFKDAIDGNEFLISADNRGYMTKINEKPYEDGCGTSIGSIEENFNKACEIVKEKFHIYPVSDKEMLLKYIETIQEPDNRINRMGCSESWYDPFYAMKQTFTKEEVEAMSDDEINNLLRLACNIQENLY